MSTAHVTDGAAQRILVICGLVVAMCGVWRLADAHVSVDRFLGAPGSTQARSTQARSTQARC
ncbi:hypothetical protein [Nocardioides sp. T2.26MG-1]|uniref:hypothetical protein n=1 Tax=Nocardioides sp. T2.26MG-1 TaxID=3041166 RepID=UPI00253F8A69|nr:hypothetical protein [Nocardioides sp. T2.26MG-1]